ncbi:hypothetical protein FXE84_02185 [Vibrio cholerae]|uniref:hypothetical protein n=1 Tax=Vibrio cholerae TaxID=666 RepID=UPI0004E2EE12|nr:hypothetical protein [Vibrio cholerae]KFE28975.1 hypothetical protein DN30_512 [Vibrio cholerae]TXY44177.1 hypothetical protein FXE84_02185 [Vibrio cholerae]
MKTAKAEHGNFIDTSMADLIKSAIDGVSVSTVLTGEKSPFGLELTIDWPNELPIDRIDFGFISYNQGRAFMCLFKHDTFGPKLVYSENSHETLVRDLAKTKSILINERTEDGSRTYSVDLKYCL